MSKPALIDGALVWRWHATHGVPLEISIPLLADRGFVPTWDRLVEAAMKDGANRGRMFRRLQPIAADSFEREFAEQVVFRLQLLESKEHL